MHSPLNIRPLLIALLAAASFVPLAAKASANPVYVPGYGASAPHELAKAFQAGAAGSLTELAGSPFPVGLTGPTPPLLGIYGLAFTPNGDHAVTSYLSKGGLLPVSVAADGSFTPTDSPSLTPSLIGLAVSPDGRFAYAPSRDFNMEAAVGVVGYQIGTDGKLEPITGGPFGSGAYGDLAITPDGRFLFATSSTGIQRFSIAADGRLGEPEKANKKGPGSLMVSPDGRFLFGGVETGVISFSIAADGALTENEPEAKTGGESLGFFSVAPDGRHIYMPDKGTSTVVVASVAADGKLTVIDSTPVEKPDSVVVAPDGRHLYWLESDGPSAVGLASIGDGGKLTPVPGTLPGPADEARRIVIRPFPAPVAQFSAVPGAVTRFDARASARAVRFHWDFGDGTSLADGGATPTHRYAKSGSYNVRLTVTDAGGCSTQRIYTGQSTLCPGGVQAARVQRVTVGAGDPAPVLSRLGLTNTRFAVAAAANRKVAHGTRFRYSLSEPAKVRITIERETRGHCKRKKCVRFKKTGTLTSAAKAGRNTTKFSGKLRGRRLRPGSYRATAIATDSAGGKSRPRHVAFRIVRQATP